MECPICFDFIINSCTGSCYHHFCFRCLTKWCVKNNTCPICKTYINQILCDKEFDLLNSQLKNLNISTNNTDCSQNFYSIYNTTLACNYTPNNIDNNIDNSNNSNIFFITICFDDNLDKNIQLTLKNNKGPGVYVSKITNLCRAYHYGMRKNDVILFINNIPCYNHKQSISLIDNCQLSSSTIVCKILRK